jgi:hypothetical protein
MELGIFLAFSDACVLKGETRRVRQNDALFSYIHQVFSMSIPYAHPIIHILHHSIVSD